MKDWGTTIIAAPSENRRPAFLFTEIAVFMAVIFSIPGGSTPTNAIA
jgi:hypothetical protein